MRKIFKKFAALVATAAMTMAMCATAFAADTYNVAGAEGLCGANWDPAENQMTQGADGVWTKEFTNIAAGTYEFKIATNGAWDNGEYNLEGDASSGGSNASVTVDKDGSTVVVSFDGEKASVEVKAPAASTDSTTAAPAETKPSAPQTADSTPVVAAVVAMLAMGCAVVALNAKKSR